MAKRRLHKVKYKVNGGIYESIFTRSGKYSFTHYQKEQLDMHGEAPVPISIEYIEVDTDKVSS